MAEADNNYIVGAGRLYFDAFAPGTKTPTGERYFGNTPELSLNVETEELEHYGSDDAVKELDNSMDLSVAQGVTFATDNISKENLALWFLGTAASVTVASATAQSEPWNDAKLGTWRQIGESASLPAGTRNITNVVLKKGATTITMAGNYEVDLQLARIYLLPNASAVVDGDDLTVQFDQSAAAFDQVIAKGQAIYGRVRFISDNRGDSKNQDYFWPYVKLTPNGDFSLKGDDYQRATFTGKIMKLNATTERQYVTGRPTT